LKPNKNGSNMCLVNCLPGITEFDLETSPVALIVLPAGGHSLNQLERLSQYKNQRKV